MTHSLSARLAKHERPSLTAKALQLVAPSTEWTNEIRAEIVYTGIDRYRRNLLTTADTQPEPSADHICLRWGKRTREMNDRTDSWNPQAGTVINDTPYRLWGVR